MNRNQWEKRLAAAGLTLALTVSMAGAVKIGAVVDYVQYTDIVAYIDGTPIRSYNVNGNTVVVAEDLADYGFDVKWNQENRSLHIALNTEGRAVTSNYQPEANTHKIGARVGSVLATDIVTKVTDYFGTYREVPSWNIGGKTVVGMDDLAKAYASSYEWNPETRGLRLESRRYTSWSRDLSAPERTDELNRGFAVRASGFFQDSKTVTLKGEGSWGGVDDLKISATGVSFSWYQRVSVYDGCLDGLSTDVATFDPIRDNLLSNKQENDQERWSELSRSMRVYVNGRLKTGELWLCYGNGHKDYTYYFDAPVNLEDVSEVFIVAGDAFWVADHAIPYQWEEASCPRGSCEILISNLAHIYCCSQSGVMHGGNFALYVVYADGTTRDYLKELPSLGMYHMNTSYSAADLALSADGTSFTFRCPVYEVHGSDPYASDYTLECKGMGTYRVDLTTKEMTLEQVSAAE